MNENHTKLIIRDMTVKMSIGVYEFEKQKTQRVLVNVIATIPNNPDWEKDTITDTVSYETIVNKIEAIASSGHIELVETLAENIASFCLSDERITDVTIRAEKPDIFECAQGVGIEIFRTRNN